MPSSHLTFCHLLLLLPSIFLSIKVFFQRVTLHIRWPKYWSFTFSIGPSSEYSGLFSFRINWFDLHWSPLKDYFFFKTNILLDYILFTMLFPLDFPGGSDGKASAYSAGDPESISWRRKWQPTPVFLPGKSHGWRSLVGHSPWSCRELDTTEQLHFHFFTFHCTEKCICCIHTYCCCCIVEQILGDSDEQRSLACCSSWGRKESNTTQLDWTYTPYSFFRFNSQIVQRRVLSSSLCYSVGSYELSL